MPITAHFSRIIIYGLPLAFVVISWLASAGFPYYLDSNESFLSYLHARHLEIWNPNEYGWLTAHGTDPVQPTTEFVYAHNPNAPRYLHYLLLRAGIRDLPYHVLILSLAGTSLTVWLLWRAFAHPALVVVPLAVVLDYAGFLSWTVNTYRVWTFVLFFGLVLATTKRQPLWVGVLTFLLFQIEYGFAFFVGVTTGVMVILTHRRHAWPLILALGIGATLSVGLFGLQVLAYYGWDGLLHELSVTYGRRGVAGESSGLLRYLYQSWHGPALLMNMVARDTHNWPVLVMVLWGILSSVFALRRGALSEPHRLLANLTVSVVVGTAAVSTVLYGYFVDGFVISMLPLASFLVGPALGIVALELRTILGRVGSWSHLAPFSTLVVLAPLVAASAAHFRPPVAVTYMHLLQTEYRGKTLVSPNFVAWQMGPALAFSLTDGRAVETSDLDVTPEDVRRFESLRDADGSLTYVCLDTLYLRQVGRPGALSTCDIAVTRMLPRGHTVVADGLGWAIVRLNREAQPPVQALDGAVGLTERVGAEPVTHADGVAISEGVPQ
jgi:hypothetical protein